MALSDPSGMANGLSCQGNYMMGPAGPVPLGIFCPPWVSYVPFPASQNATYSFNGPIFGQFGNGNAGLLPPPMQQYNSGPPMMMPYPPMPVQYPPFHFGNPGNQFNPYPVQQPMYTNEAPMQQYEQALPYLNNSSGDESWGSNDVPAHNGPFWNSYAVGRQLSSFPARRQMSNNENAGGRRRQQPFDKNNNLKGQEDTTNHSGSEEPLKNAVKEHVPRKKSKCGYCKRSGERPEVYSSHTIRDNDGNTTCPVFRRYICPRCQGTGDQGHSVSYCPQLSQEEKNQKRREKIIKYGRKRIN